MEFRSVLAPLVVLIVTFVTNRGIAVLARDNNIPLWTREDSLVWPDWLSSGGVTVVIIGAQLVRTDRIEIGPYFGVILLVASAFITPLLVKTFGYTSTSGTTPKLTWLWGVAAPNLLALCAMTVAVAVGLQVTVVGS